MTSTRIEEHEAVEVRDLDASAVLDAVVAARRAADEQEARLLALAVHWVDLHPATDGHPAASFPTQRSGGLAAALGPAFFGRAPLAGAGTPAVAEHAVEELAAALNLSHTAGLSLVSEAVELRHRLPRLWALVQDGRLQAWRARQVAGPPPSSPGTRWRSWTGTWPSPPARTGSRSWGRCCTRPGCAATRTRPPRWSRPRWSTAGCGWTTGSPPPPLS